MWPFHVSLHFSLRFQEEKKPRRFNYFYKKNEWTIFKHTIATNTHVQYQNFSVTKKQ